MMKKNSISVLIISVMMAVIMAAMPPFQAAAAQGQSFVLYISDVKIGVGKTAEEAADYTQGIHMFGSDAAYNLNNNQLVRNNKAKSVYVYYSVDDAAASSGEANNTGAAASVTTTGDLVLAATAGLAAGILGTIGVTYALKKKKKKTEE